MRQQKSHHRVIGYVRVSTEDQAREGVSLAMQEERIRAWALAQGAECSRIFRDEGLPGGRMDRPGLRDALEAAEEGGGVLVVYSLSRLARSTRGTLEVAERLERAECDLVSLSERIDTTSAAGKMVFRMLAVLAEFERDLISERVRGAMAHLKARGARVSRFERVPESVCRRARELRAGGLSLRAVGAALEAEGVRTVTGAKWSAKVVRSCILREAA